MAARCLACHPQPLCSRWLLGLVFLVVTAASAQAQDTIPVLGFGLVADTDHFAAKLVASLDFPVKHLVVVYGSNPWQDGGDIVGMHPNMTLIQTAPSLGVSEGWNLIIDAFPDERWVFIVSYDVEFPRGQLQLLAETFSHDLDSKSVELIAHIDVWQVGTTVHMGAWKEYNAFAMSRAFIDRIGGFDENVYPAYFEDDEQRYRMLLVYGDSLPLRYHHVHCIHNGLGAAYNGKPGQKALRNWDANMDYVSDKWGCAVIWETSTCEYTRPWNQSSWDIGDWVFDLQHRLDIGGVRTKVVAVY